MIIAHRLFQDRHERPCCLPLVEKKTREWRTRGIFLVEAGKNPNNFEASSKKSKKKKFCIEDENGTSLTLYELNRQFCLSCIQLACVLPLFVRVVDCIRQHRRWKVRLRNRTRYHYMYRHRRQGTTYRRSEDGGSRLKRACFLLSCWCDYFIGQVCDSSAVIRLMDMFFTNVENRLIRRLRHWLRTHIGSDT